MADTGTLHTARWREIRDYVRAVLDVQAAEQISLRAAKNTVALALKIVPPTDAEFRQVRGESRSKGRPPAIHFSIAQDFAILAALFRATGQRDYIKHTVTFWERATHAPQLPITVTRQGRARPGRAIVEALAEVNHWSFDDLDKHAALVRRKYRL